MHDTEDELEVVERITEPEREPLERRAVAARISDGVDVHAAPPVVLLQLGEQPFSSLALFRGGGNRWSACFAHEVPPFCVYASTN